MGNNFNWDSLVGGLGPMGKLIGDMLEKPKPKRDTAKTAGQKMVDRVNGPAGVEMLKQLEDEYARRQEAYESKLPVSRTDIAKQQQQAVANAMQVERYAKAQMQQAPMQQSMTPQRLAQLKLQAQQSRASVMADAYMQQREMAMQMQAQMQQAMTPNQQLALFNLQVQQAQTASAPIPWMEPTPTPVSKKAPKPIEDYSKPKRRRFDFDK